MRHVTSDVIVSDSKGNILLVERAQHLTEGGKLALPGGYISRDENIETAAKREVLEETGYECTNVKLFAITSDPTRPGNDRQDINFFFTGTAGEKVQEGDDESTSVGWFPLDDLPSPDRFAFDHLVFIKHYQRHGSEQFALPILA